MTGASRSSCWSRATVVLLGAAVLGACGGSQYRYLESNDGHLFGKIPADWEVQREGAVEYRLLLEVLTDNPNVPGVPIVEGDSTVPWRAEFAADGPARDVPYGSFESQHIDARLRDMLLSDWIERIRVGAENYERVGVTVGDLDGYRVKWTTGEGDAYRRYDEVFLIDERRSGLYVASVRCDDECHERYAAEIDEILTSFRVEP